RAVGGRAGAGDDLPSDQPGIEGHGIDRRPDRHLPHETGRRGAAVRGASETSHGSGVEADRMRVLSVMNQKGGCGKTTTAVDLAGGLATRRQKVLVVDLDPQAHAPLGLNGRLAAPVTRSLHDALMRRCSLEPYLAEVAPGFDLAPSGDDLFFAERDLGYDESSEDRLHECLRLTPRRYDFVVIDCPPSL